MNFDLSGIIAQAWNEVAEQYATGLVPNESVCNFCLSRSIFQLLPKDVHLTFDSRVSEYPLYRSDLTIWSACETRTALFIGEVKYWPHYNGARELWRVEQDIAKLKELLQQKSLGFLTIDPSTGYYEEVPAAINADTQIGFFITAREDSSALKLDYLRGILGDSEAHRFHIATGTVFNESSRIAEFKYFPPVTELAPF